MCESCKCQGTFNTPSTAPQARVWEPSGGLPCPFPLSAGDMHGTAVRRILAETPLRETDPLQPMLREIDRLTTARLISSWEGDILRGIAEVVTRGEDLDSALRFTLAAHHRLLDHGPGGEVALTISSIAVDSLQMEIGSGGVAGRKAGVAAADLKGALDGAGIGKEFGVTGALIGALAGAVFGSVAAALEARAVTRS
jgi:hypothetical protein